MEVDLLFQELWVNLDLVFKNISSTVLKNYCSITSKDWCWTVFLQGKLNVIKYAF